MVADLEALGAIFVDDEGEVPEGGVIVFSAHGVAPEVYENAARRGLSVIDATCPARDEGAHGGPPLRRTREHDPFDRT